MDVERGFTPLEEALHDLMRRVPAGLPAVEPVLYACSRCQDMGVVRVDVPIDDPRFGKMFDCPENCEAVQRRKRTVSEKLLNAGDWEKSYGDWSFKTFQEWSKKRFQMERSGLSKEDQAAGHWYGKSGAYASTRQFAHCLGKPFTLNEASQATFKHPWPDSEVDADRPSHSLVLYGGVGCGKTGLAVAATNAARKQGVGVIFTRALTLLEKIKATYDEEKAKERDEMETASGLVRFYSDVPVLVLDEFGVENYTKDRKEKVQEIIRTRDRKGLPFMVTTNLHPDQLYEFWGGQIADIIAKAHLVPMAGVKLRWTAQAGKVW